MTWKELKERLEAMRANDDYEIVFVDGHESKPRPRDIGLEVNPNTKRILVVLA